MFAIRRICDTAPVTPAEHQALIMLSFRRYQQFSWEWRPVGDSNPCWCRERALLRPIWSKSGHIGTTYLTESNKLTSLLIQWRPRVDIRPLLDHERRAWRSGFRTWRLTAGRRG